ncbi:uncharacterized protein FFMR_05550 [Fusarium fujikuroi]|nr:uncharacterized protein FFMR_05550 [Fusarium fujikuroi]
MAFNYTRH